MSSRRRRSSLSRHIMAGPSKSPILNGCSDGGRQGLKAAQMFPKDFDGIIAGSAFPNNTGNETWAFTDLINSVNAGLVGAPRTAALTIAQNGATAACDALDSVTDGLIRDPRVCHFDPHTLVCKKTGQTACLTEAQADAIKANYRTLRDPVTGKYVMSGMMRGSEFNQATFNFTAPPFNLFAINAYKLAYNNPNWDPATFNLHRDLPVLETALGSNNALDTDLRPFKNAGGKLIQWHGWTMALRLLDLLLSFMGKRSKELAGAGIMMRGWTTYRASIACS